MQGKINRGKEKLADMFELPRDVIMDLPKITIIGESEVTIENHKGIDVFESELIKIRTKLKTIVIKGERFEILYIGGSTVTISGKFKSISYGV